MTKIEYVTVDVILLHFTDKAALFEIDGAEYWIPRVALSYQSDRYIVEENLAEALEVKIARWKAKEEHLIR